MLRFLKYHGLGNDFVIVDRLTGGPPISAADAARLCDRHRGVGADGVLVVWPEPGAAARMQVWNADGSEAQNCGNGLRCVARYLYDSGAVPTAVGAVAIRAGDGTYRCERRAGDRYAVAMGRARFAHPDLPGPGCELEDGGARFAATSVHLGNPHAVIVVRDGDPRALAAAHGPALERHPSFPRRVNVTFAKPEPSGFEAAVFERGVGLTCACGTGAAALAAAAVQTGLWPASRPMSIRQPGGALSVVVDGGGEIVVEGEAVRVFAGEVSEP
ncbi:MAG: diaminopimelate epimerase [Deltaproteobacteria bacterium]|nr:diaminopimelate epimerase [Deltaproteobacteria bacterium]